MSKLCALPGCEEAIARRFVMCPQHWRRVPPDLQGAVYRTWERILEHPTNQPLEEFREYMAAYRTAVDAAVKAIEAVAA